MTSSIDLRPVRPCRRYRRSGVRGQRPAIADENRTKQLLARFSDHVLKPYFCPSLLRLLIKPYASLLSKGHLEPPGRNTSPFTFKCQGDLPVIVPLYNPTELPTLLSAWTRFYRSRTIKYTHRSTSGPGLKKLDLIERERRVLIGLYLLKE
jgi:hypothetical protein